MSQIQKTEPHKVVKNQKIPKQWIQYRTSEPTETGSSDTLPATATNKYNMMLVGLALIIVGTILAIIISKNMSKHS